MQAPPRSRHRIPAPRHERPLPATARDDGRLPTQIRATTLEPGYLLHAEGSCLISMGNTKVICTASVEEGVPLFRKGKGGGWVTAEYGMLPRSTGTRNARESTRGRVGGRTQEIQRLIGRSLRAVCDMKALGERQVIVDCDVLQADGGTRTASICGGYVALHDALTRIGKSASLTDSCAAVSVGVIDAIPMLDLEYTEDVRAEVDMNVVMTGSGRFIEVQGTAEGMPFSKDELQELLSLAEHGIASILDAQAQVLATPPAPRS